MHELISTVTREYSPQDTILASLQPLHKLAHLRIVIQSNWPAEEDIDRDTESDPGVSVLHPPALDFQGTATSLLRQLPLLQSLFLTTSGYFTRCEEVTNERWCISGAWRVAAHTDLSAGCGGRDEEGTRGLVELRHEEAEAAIQREELVIPDAYKVSVSRHCCLVSEPGLSVPGLQVWFT